MTTTTDCQNYVPETLSTTTLNLNDASSGSVNVPHDTSEDVVSTGDGKEKEAIDGNDVDTEEEEDDEEEDEEILKPVYLKALYDYEYKYDSGETVTMTTGDVYELKSKASFDWWQVQYMKDGTSFHVPACYVQVLENYDPGFNRTLPPIKPKITKELEKKDINQNLNENPPENPTQQSSEHQDQNSPEIKEENPIPSPSPVEDPDVKSCDIKNIGIEKHRKQPAPLAPSTRSEFNKPNYHRTLSSGDSSTSSFCSSPTAKNFNLSSFGNNSIPDNCIQVVVGNSEHMSPMMRIGGCSTFGKGPPSNRPKSYHCGSQSSFFPNSPEPFHPLKTVESVNDYMNVDEIRSCMKEGKQANTLENITEKAAVTSPSSDEYQNVAIIQASIKTPPKMDNCKFVRNYSPSWEMYVDNNSRHTFYYNKESGKTTWKPPRPENAPPDIPEWRQNVDSNGRRYYYKEGSDESCWDLPVLDDITDSESDRSGNSMVKSMTLQPQGSSKHFPQRSKTLPQMSSIIVDKPGSFSTERHPSPTPSILNAVKDKAAFLNKTKVMENGKKVGKKMESVLCEIIWIQHCILS